MFDEDSPTRNIQTQVPTTSHLMEKLMFPLRKVSEAEFPGGISFGTFLYPKDRQTQMRFHNDSPYRIHP